MTHEETKPRDDPGLPRLSFGGSRVVLVCEHASRRIPAPFDGLGLSTADSASHAAWDIGAWDVTKRMAAHLDASVVAASVSRLVYDCNRPPDAPDAMPARSEVIEVPGNRDLSAQDKAARVESYYRPFHGAMQRALAHATDPIIVTIHSFTATYHGTPRMVEIGILHDADTRLADAMLQVADAHTNLRVARNAPYGPSDGVTHTLREHALPAGHHNVMVEIRNDLITTPAQHDAMAVMLSRWLLDALAQLSAAEALQCRV